MKQPRTRLLRTVALALSLAGLLVGCAPETDPADLLRAKQAESRHELVGGPVAYADVGDFILENDQVRVGILGYNRSWGPGVFGGGLVDADLRRDDGFAGSGQGRDRLAELFPFANLLVPAPYEGNVSVVADGSDGETATVRVEGRGQFLFEALGVLRNQRSLLEGFLGLQALKTEADFRTDYTLKPGDRHVTMKTWFTVPGDAEGGAIYCEEDDDCGDDKGGNPLVCDKAEGAAAGLCRCPPLQGCATECPLGYAQDAATGCPICECSEALTMEFTDGDESVFGVILGESALIKPDDQPAPERKGGIGGGDFVFFGNQNDIFAPGTGFDEEKPVWDAIFGGRDTFQQPLAFDFVAASGGDISYGYFTKKLQAADPDPKVMVPVFTSAATAMITAFSQCSWSEDDDETCEKARVYEFERYLAIGKGDVASVADVVFDVRGTPVGTIEGMVRWRATGTPAANATVFVMRDPDAALPADQRRDWAALGLDALVAANLEVDGLPGVLNSADADVGLDLVEDGDFRFTMPAGRYVLFAMDAQRVVHGDLIAVDVEVDKTDVVLPSLPTPGLLHVQTTDQYGRNSPAKLTLVALDDNDEPLERDGVRRPYLGQGRLGNGILMLRHSENGAFTVPVPAGRYEVVLSRGPEYGLHREKVVIDHGQQRNIAGVVAREVDTTGWIAGDFHLHARPSFDSGMPLPARVRAVAAEGVEYVASTDHDIMTDYRPTIETLDLGRFLKSTVSAETSTLELGHYISFPMAFDANDLPNRGSVDWFCKPTDELFTALRDSNGFGDEGKKPTVVIAHQRDGFIGWADQMGMNPFNLKRVTPSLEENNPVLRTVGCDHDAFEVFNSKRFDLIRTPTAWEVQVFERCLWRIDCAGHPASVCPVEGKGPLDEVAAVSELRDACPELDTCSGLQADGEACPPEHGLARYAARCSPGDDLLTCLAGCREGERIEECKQRYRTALGEIISSEILRRTPAEQDAWFDAPTDEDPTIGDGALDDLIATCRVAKGKLAQPIQDVLPPEDFLAPCAERNGMLEDYFRLVEHGMVRTMTGGSDSHGLLREPGVPRTYIRSATDEPQDLDDWKIAKSLQGGNVVASYGPFVEVDIGGGGPGDLVAVSAGTVDANIRVQTASWFAVDRVEVYVNGRLVEAIDLDAEAQARGEVHTKEKIVDFEGTVALTIPDRDSHVVVVAQAVDPERSMAPVYIDVPFGELQLPRVAALGFAQIPLVSSVFPPPVRVPDFFGVQPYAVTNAVLLDVDGNGAFDTGLPRPGFCSPACDPDTGALTDGSGLSCTDLQADYVCLQPEARCGLPIAGTCDIYSDLVRNTMGGLFGGHAGRSP